MDIHTKKVICEDARDVPVSYEVDVAVAGAGISGLFAALAAARSGASTVLVDRFNWIGGNNGPGMIIGGGAFNDEDTTVQGGLSPLIKEYKHRVESMLSCKNADYAEYSNTLSHVASKMLDEADVKMLLSMYICDPIIENGKVKGFFIESASGRSAILAKIVIDATGDAALTSKAGAPMIRSVLADTRNDVLIYGERNKAEYDNYNETGILGMILGTNVEKHQKFHEDMIKARQSGNDIPYNEWTKSFENLHYKVAKFDSFDEDIKSLYFGRKTYIKDKCYLWSRVFKITKEYTTIQVFGMGDFYTDDMYDISLLETEMRKKAFDLSMFLRKYVPGFEESYLAFISPFTGARGGPCIEGEVTLSVIDAIDGTKYEDALFRNVHEALCHEKKGDPTGFDVSFRMCLPKELEGLLVSGRGASYIRRGHDPTGMRNRCSMMTMGQALGIVAAMAITENQSLSELDIQDLQQRLSKEGIL